MRFEPLTDEQRREIERLMARHGRRGWRRALHIAWERASASAPLQQLRNTHGPAWLNRVRIASLQM